MAAPVSALRATAGTARRMERPAPAAETGRALVAVEPPRSCAPASSIMAAPCRAQAAFVTQLIATAEQWPQTRARCRAEPQAAAALYRAALARVAPDGDDASLGPRELISER